MSRTEPGIPWRVIAIAVVLFVVVVSVAWMIFGPESTPVATTEVPTGAGMPTAPGGAAGDSSAAPTDPGTTDPTQQLTTTGAVELDPLSPEARAEFARIRATTGTMELQLFLIVPGLERLIPVPRTVEAPPGIDAQVKRAVQELIDWSGTETISPLPSQAGIREVWVSPGGIAYIDFDADFSAFSGSGSLGELHTVYSIVTTLALSFPEIVAVQILIEGKWVETLAGHVDLSLPLVPSADWALIESGVPPEQDSRRDSGDQGTRASNGR